MSVLFVLSDPQIYFLIAALSVLVAASFAAIRPRPGGRISVLLKAIAVAVWDSANIRSLLCVSGFLLGTAVGVAMTCVVFYCCHLVLRLILPPDRSELQLDYFAEGVLLFMAGLAITPLVSSIAGCVTASYVVRRYDAGWRCNTSSNT